MNIRVEVSGEMEYTIKVYDYDAELCPNGNRLCKSQEDRGDILWHRFL